MSMGRISTDRIAIGKLPTRLEVLVSDAQHLVRASGRYDPEDGGLDVALEYFCGEDGFEWNAAITSVNSAVRVGEGARFFSGDRATPEAAMEHLIEVLKERL